MDFCIRAAASAVRHAVADKLYNESIPLNDSLETSAQKSPPQVFPLGGESSTFRLELVTQSEAAPLAVADEPFVHLAEGGLTSRVLLARVVAGKAEAVAFVALKVRRNTYRLPSAPGQLSQVNNRLIDASWEAERQNLLQAPEELGSLHPGFLPWINTGLFPPIFHCTASKNYFHPPCPSCGRPLRTCRDDTLLQAAGLRPYSESSVRYLYCATCAEPHRETPEALVFWTHSRNPDETVPPRAKIRRSDELYEDIWPLIERAAADSLDAETRENLSRCFAPGSDFSTLVREKIAPVSFYDTEIFPLQVQHFTFDEYCDLLGGANWEDLWKGGAIAGFLPGREEGLKKAQEVISEGRQFLFEGDDSGLFPLECLLLKLLFYRELCAHALMLHKEHKRPHLDIKPSHVMVTMGQRLETAPARWNFRVALLDLGATMPFTAEGMPADAPRIFWPPLEPDSFYSTPFVRDEIFGKNELAHLIIRTSELLTDPDGKHRARLEVDVVGQALRARKMSRRDLLVLTIPLQGRELQQIRLWGNPSDLIDNGVRFLGVSSVIDEATYTSLEAMTNRVMHDREVSYYRAFNVPCDIYSLGILLFRALLVHDSQDIQTVGEALKYIEGRIELSLPRGEPADPARVRELVLEHIRSDTRTFNRFSLLYNKEKRAGNRNAIPEDLWEDLLLLAFRMTTWIPGFSLCDDSGDFDPADPSAAAGKVLEEIEDATHRAWAELFGSQAINRDMLTAIDAVVDEIDSAG